MGLKRAVNKRPVDTVSDDCPPVEVKMEAAGSSMGDSQSFYSSSEDMSCDQSSGDGRKAKRQRQKLDHLSQEEKLQRRK